MTVIPILHTQSPETIPQLVVEAIEEALDKLAALVIRVCSAIKVFLDDLVQRIQLGINYTLRKACEHFAHKTITQLVAEDYYEGKIEALRLNHRLLTKSDASHEACRFLAKYLERYVSQYVAHFDEVDENVRPDWIEHLLEEPRADGSQSFTLIGEALRSFLVHHQKLFTDTLEVNILKIVYRLHEKINELQNENPNFLLDFVKDSCRDSEFHFDDLTQPISLWPDEKLVNFQALEERLLRLILPHGAEDLEIPGPELLQQQIREPIFKLICEQITPKLLVQVFELLKDSRVKDRILFQGFSFLKDFVNEETRDDSLCKEESLFSSNYTDQPAFNKAIGSAFIKFFEYIEPSLLKKLFLFIRKEDIGDTLGPCLSEQIQRLTLPDLMAQAILIMLYALNGNGNWVEKSQELCYIEAPIVFPKTEEDQEILIQEETSARDELRKELQRLLDEIGKDPKGLMQLARKKYMPESQSKQNVREEEKDTSFFSRISGFFLSGLSSTANKAKSGLISFSVQQVSQKIHFLGKEAFQKMDEPVHDRLYQLLAQNVITYATG